MKRLIIPLILTGVPLFAQAREAHCLQGTSELQFVNAHIIDERSGYLFSRVEKVSDDLFLLDNTEPPTAYRVAKEKGRVTLTPVGGDQPTITCFNSAQDRAKELAVIEAQVRQEQQEAQAKRQQEERQRKAKEAAKKIAEQKAKERQALKEKKLREVQQDQDRAERRVGDMQGYIQGLLQQAWRIPSTARNGMSAVVAINLFPSGEIDQAYIQSSSGDQAFDRSALQAVYRVERFERISDLDSIEFERAFRRLVVTFRPEGLRW